MISDDTLTLYYYRDGLDDDERHRVREALAADRELAARYLELSRSLDELADVTPIEAPPEAVVRWRHAIDEAAARSRLPGFRTPLFLAAAAVLALGIGIGLWLDEPAPESETLIVEVTQPRPAVVRGVSQFLRDTRAQLVSLDEAETDDRIALITALIEQNRLFERAAELNDAPDLARVLRAFEQQLRELARQEATPDEIDRTSDRLSFEYAVTLTRLERGASKQATTL